MLHQNNMAKISFKLKILLSFLIFTGLFTQLLQHDENNFNNFTSTSWDAIVPYDAQGFVTHVRLIGNTEVDSYFSAQSGDGLTAQTAYTFGPDTRNFNYNIYFQIENASRFLNISNLNIINEYLPEDSNNYGFYIRNCENINIKDSLMDGFVYGLYLRDSNNILIEDNVLDNSIQAIVIQNCTNVIIRNNAITTTDNDAIQISDSSDFVVEGNEIENSGDSGLLIQNSSGFDIFSNTITGSGGHGIFLDNVLNSIVGTNIISGSDGVGIMLGPGVSGLSLFSNDIVYNSAGIGFSSSVGTNNDIYENYFYGNDDNPFDFGGDSSGTDIWDNWGPDFNQDNSDSSWWNPDGDSNTGNSGSSSWFDDLFNSSGSGDLPSGSSGGTGWNIDVDWEIVKIVAELIGIGAAVVIGGMYLYKKQQVIADKWQSLKDLRREINTKEDLKEVLAVLEHEIYKIPDRESLERIKSLLKKAVKDQHKLNTEEFQPQIEKFLNICELNFRYIHRLDTAQEFSGRLEFKEAYNEAFGTLQELNHFPEQYKIQNWVIEDFRDFLRDLPYPDPAHLQETVMKEPSTTYRP